MAKLTGVKTIDMVNGEITKVEYNGEHYVKVDGQARVGDIVAIEKPWYDEIYRGDFFSVERVTVRNWGKFVYVDGNANGEQDDVIPFRKYGQKYSNERRPQVGDRVKVVKAYGSQGKYQNGDILTIKWVDQDDDGRFKVEENDRPIRDFEVELIGGKQSAPTSASDNLTDRVASLEQRVDSLEGNAQETYRLVTDREPKAGDFVKFDDPDNGDITIGKYYEIIEVDSAGDPQIVDDAGDKYDTYGEEFEVYEKVSTTQPETIRHNGATYTLVGRKAQPGDVVVFTESDSPFVTNGKSYGPVTEEDGNLYVADDYDDEDRVKVYNIYFNRKSANVKVYAPVAPKVEPLKVGDYAKVVNASDFHFLSDGDVVEILGDACAPTNHSVKRLSDGKVQRVPKDQLVRLTDEEVTQAKAQQAEIERWEAIGRKPNEYKKGDIVRITHKYGARSVSVGDIVEVGRPCDSSGFFDAKYGYVLDGELITPVESRFDRK